MKNTFAAIKFWMDKILSIACAVLLTFMTVSYTHLTLPTNTSV